MHKRTGVDIEGGNVHPFNSNKVIVHTKVMEGIVNEDYYPPVVFNLDVSGSCQYKCGHCHHRRKQVKSQHMGDLPESLARTFPYFLQHWEREGQKVKGCCIVGSQGDALMYPHLPKLLKDLHFVGVETGLVTNGYGFTDELLNHAAFFTRFTGFSIDAGTEKGYNHIKQCPDDAWKKVCENVGKLTGILRDNNLRNDVGWKILILPDTQYDIYLSCQIAKDLGCRYVQIRPADLPEKDRHRIDQKVVHSQIERAISLLEVPGEFEIVGVRHKFTPEFKQVLPDYCYLTPLTVTVTSDGKAYPCVDRRCEEDLCLADCSEIGWQALREAWGSMRHLYIVKNKINCRGKGPDCKIRCSNFGHDRFFQDFILEDKTDRNLI